MSNHSLAGHRVPLAPSLSRRSALHALGAAGLALGLGAWPRVPWGKDGLAAPSPALPPSVGQSDVQVYVEASGHTLHGVFLDYWRANGAASIYGNPISEPFITGNGYYSQAFEAAVFQYRPEYQYTEDPIVRLLPVGWTALQNLDIDSHPLAAEDRAVQRVLADGGVFNEGTGHTISGRILDWYRFNEGAFFLGRPLSEPTPAGSRIIQVFEGGVIRDDEAGVTLEPIVADLATPLGLERSPVDRGDLPDFDELLFWLADPPDLRNDPYTPGAKWIEISLGEQRLRAYHGETLIATNLVSTGIAPNGTDVGMFRIRLKYPVQDMVGFTSETGEVLGFGEAPAGTVPYAVTDVPHVMYFNLEAEAFHGAYWHNSFGQPMSHGCVNLSLDFAAWLYGWAPLGTGVWVHE